MNRKATIAFLQSQNAYKGASRLNQQDLTDYAEQVRFIRANGVAEAINLGNAADLHTLATENAKEAAKTGKPEKKKATKRSKGPSKSVDAQVSRTLREGTLAKFQAAVASADVQDDGTVIVTEDHIVAAGLGRSWTRTPNSMWNREGAVQQQAAAAAGYTAHGTRGTIVLTPIATAAEEVAS